MTVDKLEHLKSQLDLTTYSDLISQLEELILKFEPLDSACSSRRSSISSHVGILTFNGFFCTVRFSTLGSTHLWNPKAYLSFHIVDFFFFGGSGGQSKGALF